MKDTLGLLVCVSVYTLVVFVSGLIFQTKFDQRQLKKFEEAAFTDGCKKCAMFEKMACSRDQLQNGEGLTQVP